MKHLISIDIGSTFTKGALFELHHRELQFSRRFQTPTTTADLQEGVITCLRALLEEDESCATEKLFRKHPVYYSSSAKGGLSITAIGLVPDLTVKAAHMAACNAGGRICGTYSFSLTPRDISSIETQAPDVILLTGGTDGGHRRHIIHNAEMLARSALPARIVYAGNRDIVPEVQTILKGHTLFIADNVMPEVDVLNVDSARHAIRKIFLDTIAAGKGLGGLRKQTGRDPLPTPAGVLAIIDALCSIRPEFENVIAVDIGGATTDVYSHASPQSYADDIIPRGVPEPDLKRTVEGNLGLRVSAESLLPLAELPRYKTLFPEGLSLDAFKIHLRHAAEETSMLPQTEQEKILDRFCARLCLMEALSRHAGTREKHFGPTGPLWVQRGKDLSGVQKMIFTGGYLAHRPDDTLYNQRIFAAGPDSQLLLPGTCAMLFDRNLLLPLLGNLAGDHRREAAALAAEELTPCRQRI